ncbi:MAG: hypothetical protein Q4D19_12605 [Lautropia sp.]|nr:hypothetical protein [Lautropia sp.]
MHLRLTVFILKQSDRILGSAPLGVESEVESGLAFGIALQVLVLLHAAPRSKIEIARELGREKPNRHLNELMTRLVASGDVAYSIPEKPNSRLQKYVLTDQGLGKLPSRQR